jgi:hypothetical protein
VRDGPDALIIPAPKNDVWPGPPVHCGSSSTGHDDGQASGEADARTSAATASAGMFG